MRLLNWSHLLYRVLKSIFLRQIIRNIIMFLHIKHVLDWDYSVKHRPLITLALLMPLASPGSETDLDAEIQKKSTMQ